MHIVVSWKTVFRQIGWTVGYCPYCQDIEAVRVDEAIRVFSLYFIPVNKTRVGKVGRCDFCERRVDLRATGDEVGLTDWTRSDGLHALFRKGWPSEELVSSTAEVSEARLHSLLAATEEASSVANLDVGAGITVGMTAGVAFAVPLGMFLFEHRIVQTRLDEFGFVALGVMIGLALGAIVGVPFTPISRAGRLRSKRSCRPAGNTRLICGSWRSYRSPMPIGFRMR